MIFHLPELPPPLSSCFKNVARNGRAKTARYKAWIMGSTLSLRSQMQGGTRQLPLTETVSVVYQLVRPDARKRDLGNLEKGLSDILVSTGILVDDSQIVDLRLMWHESDMPVIISILDIGK